MAASQQLLMLVLLMPFASALVAKPVKKHGDKPSLLEAGIHGYHQKKATAAKAKGDGFGQGWTDPSTWYGHDTFKPNWFGDFSQGESTYSFDGTKAGLNTNPALDYQDGWNPQEVNPTQQDDHQIASAKFFLEATDGGATDALESTFARQNSNIAGNRIGGGDFYVNQGGAMRQEYVTGPGMHDQAEKIPASWFDSQAGQMDGFGRHQMPAPSSPQAFLTYSEKSVNASMTCKTPGCKAEVIMTAPFDWAKDDHHNCRLSMFFHSTDFDDQYSGEAVEYILVNGKRVSSSCRPHVQGGCDNLTARALVPCVNDYPIDFLLESVDIKVEAKISKTVDECPYQGNLLSAVPMVTCLVKKKAEPLVIAKPPVVPAHDKCVTTKPLQCASRGCTAPLTMYIDPSCVSKNKCTLDVKVSPTDFDNLDGSKEFVEFIKVNGKKVATNLNPGLNPCKSRWHSGIINDGMSDWVKTQNDYSFTAIKGMSIDVPADGNVLIEGKITDFVDECASNGYLFDALAQVTCEQGEHSASKSSDESAPKATGEAKGEEPAKDEEDSI